VIAWLAGVTGRIRPLAFSIDKLPGEADPYREALMAHAPVADRSSNGTPVRARPVPAAARKQELARTLQRKLAEGFEIESESETHATLVIKGRRRWFGLSNAPSVRYEVTVDDRGQATNRRL
jgi:hypothetical protein